MRGDEYREMSVELVAKAEAIKELAYSKEEWEASVQLITASQYLWSVGAWLDKHDEVNL